MDIALGDIAGVRRGASVIPNPIEIGIRNRRSLEIRVRNRDEWLRNLTAIDGITVVR